MADKTKPALVLKIELAWYNVDWEPTAEEKAEIEKAISKVLEKAVGKRNVNGVSIL